MQHLYIQIMSWSRTRKMNNISRISLPWEFGWSVFCIPACKSNSGNRVIRMYICTYITSFSEKTSAALLWRRHASCNRSFVNVHEKPRQGIRQHCLVKASRPSPAQLCYSAIPDKKSYPSRKLFASNPLELHEGRIKRKRPKKETLHRRE